jgi:ferric-dicitrate binding protein FerR (iron transport regulator)
VNETQEMIDAYVDRELTSQQQDNLARWLSADHENARVFIRKAWFHRQLRQALLADAGAAHANRSPIVRLPIPIVWASALAACAVLAAAIYWFFSPVPGEPVLVQLEGAGITIERQGQALPAAARLPLRTGDILHVPNDSRAIIGFSPEATQITVQSNATFGLSSLSHGKRFVLSSGKLEASVGRQRLFKPMIVTTPQALARVVGTRFTLTVKTNSTRLDVAEGKIQFTRLSDDISVRVTAGHYSLAGPDAELSALPFTGSITRQWWANFNGRTINDALTDPRYPNQYDGSDLVPSLMLPPLKTNHVLMRYCGYLQPSVTGKYEFWLSGSAGATLFLSPNDQPGAKVTIANTLGSQFDAPRFQGPSPWAPPVPLIAGHSYYIELLIIIRQEEGNFSIAWKRSDAARENIPTDCLSPLIPK